MKIAKILLILSLAISVIFFAFRKSENISLEGDWQPTKVVLDNKDYFPKNQGSDFFAIGNKIVVNNWEDSLHILKIGRANLSAKFVIKRYVQDFKIILSSKEKSLNGNFSMEIDTTHIGPQSYIVKVKLKSDKTYLNFQRTVVIPPWKPQFPRKGQV